MRESEQQLILSSLHDDIWLIIIQFVSIEELYYIKFFCKRFFNIALLSKKLNYYRIISLDIIDLKRYERYLFV